MKSSLRREVAVLLALLLALASASAAAAEASERDLTPLPEAWFDDAVFIGDSISVVLGQEAERNGGLGDALFLCEFSYSVRNAVTGVLTLWYRGERYFPWEVLPLTGAGKVFIMLGVNDVAREGGIDKTLDCWEELCGKIKAACPEIQIFIQSELPVWHEILYDGLNNPNLVVYNERLKRFCEDNGFVFVDIADSFRDEYGGLAEPYTSDYYVHISFNGAAHWIEMLKNPSVYSEDPRNYGEAAGERKGK